MIVCCVNFLKTWTASSTLSHIFLTLHSSLISSPRLVLSITCLLFSLPPLIKNVKIKVDKKVSYWLLNDKPQAFNCDVYICAVIVLCWLFKLLNISLW